MGLFDAAIQNPAPTVPESPAPAAASSLVSASLSEQGLVQTVGEVPPLDVGFRGAPVQPSQDLDRIASLPRRKVEFEKDTRAAAAWTEHLRRKDGGDKKCDCVERWGYCILELRAIQGWGLECANNANGLLGLVGVGHGKEGLCILAPFAFEKCERAALFLPANLKPQLLTQNFPQWSAHFNVPSLAGGAFTAGRPVLYVLSYHELSNAAATDLLRRIRPDLIILNEAHNLGRPEAARTKRFDRYMKENPKTRLFAVSGTLTKKSIKDYAHLSEYALRDRSPLPLFWPTVDEWAGALDASDRPAPMGQLRIFCRAGETARDGFRRRLVETEGVVASEEGALDTILRIEARSPADLPAEIEGMIDDVRETWQRPDGEELVDALTKANVCRQLASGFFYRWRWPRQEPEPLRVEWLNARKDWRKEVRDALKRAREHLDSPLLLARAAIRWHEGFWHIEPNGERRFVPPHTRNAPQPTWEALCWPRWKENKDKCLPETEAVWVNDFLVRDAAEWAKKHVGIVWYEHGCFGPRVAQLAGIPHYGGGPDASTKILSEKAKRSIVASIKAHGTGKNLQMFSRNLIANPPSDGAAWEQLLARTHRPHQKADDVIADVYRHTEEMCEAFDRAVSRARYIQETTGSKQKLLYAKVGFEIKQYRDQRSETDGSDDF
jgi:hypothetical protein